MRFSATRLRELRHTRGLSRDHLAYHVGVTRDALGYWEQGRHTPQARHLAALARELGVSIEALFEPEEVPA